jgi:hypothetical protein
MQHITVTQSLGLQQDWMVFWHQQRIGKQEDQQRAETNHHMKIQVNDRDFVVSAAVEVTRARHVLREETCQRSRGKNLSAVSVVWQATGRTRVLNILLMSLEPPMILLLCNDHFTCRVCTFRVCKRTSFILWDYTGDYLCKVVTGYILFRAVQVVSTNWYVHCGCLLGGGRRPIHASTILNPGDLETRREENSGGWQVWDMLVAD